MLSQLKSYKSGNFSNLWKRRKPLAILLLAHLIVGCTGNLKQGAQSSSRKVFHQSNDFIYVVSRENDSFSQLAADYLGSDGQAVRLASINKPLLKDGGQVVAIPRRVFNRSGVTSEGIRTIPILCYHRFTTKPKSRHKMVVTAEMFRKQMDYLARNNYTVIGLEELPEYLEGNREIPDRSVVITIDDGYKSTYTVAYPILKEFDFTATLFLYTDFVGGGAAANWKQLSEMKDSGTVDVQSHSKSHTSFARAKLEKKNYKKWVRTEVEEPNKLIKKNIGHKVSYFAYPYGDNTEEVVQQLQASDISLAVTVQKGGNPAYADPMRLRRTMIYGDDSFKSFKQKLQVLVRP